MGRYISPPDLWDAATRAALDSGALRLQPGQWIKTGDGPNLSRFYRHNPATGHIVAFHGAAPHATRKLRQYVASGTAIAARQAANRAARLSPPTAPLYRVCGAVLRRIRP